MLNTILRENKVPADTYAPWRKEIQEKTQEFPMWYPEREDVIIPQWAIKVQLDARDTRSECY